MSIVDYDWLILALLLPVIIFPRPITAPLLLIIPLLWLLRRLSTGRFIVGTPADWAILLLLVMLLVSLYATFDLAFSVPRVIGIVYGVAVFYAAAAFAGRSQRHLLWGVAALLICGLVVAIISLLGTQWPAKLPFLPSIAGRLPQILLPAVSDGISPNQVAGTLLWVIPICIALTIAATYETRFLRLGTARVRLALVLLGGVSLVVLGTFLLTQSRGGFVGLAVALLFMVFVARTSRKVVLIAVMLAIIVLLVSLWALPATESLSGSDPFARVNPAAEVDGSSYLREETLGRRLEIWSRALYGLQDFPFTGMGVGTFRRVVPVLYPLLLISPDRDIAHAHNHLLQSGLDLGLPGLVAYLALWILAGFMLWRSWRLRQNSWQAALVIGFSGVLTGYFVYGMTDAVALGAKPGFIFWLVLGLIAGTHNGLVQSRRTVCQPSVDISSER